MDSGNSGSVPSSSGGDEEYDSSLRPLDASNFFNSSISNPPTLYYPNNSSQNNLDPFSHSQPNQNLYNLDFWSKNLRSNDPPPQSSVPPPQPPAPQHPPPDQVKNPKKRTRASRRAPTTVLKTDTANFRQMVQEFTGIPTAPFSAAASPYSRRLDLFGAAALGGSLYPLPPSAQKVVQPSLPYNLSSSNNLVDSLANTTNVNVATASSNYPQSQNMLNMQQNQIFNFQSLLQSHQEPNSIFGGAKSSQENSRIPNLDDLGMTNDHVNANVSGFSGHQSSTGVRGPSHVDDEHFGPFSQQNLQPAEKGTENVSSRGEGTVDSWNFPSD